MRKLTWSAVVLVATSALPALAQESSPIGQYATCVGGFWVADEVMTDNQGRTFSPARECRWAASGTALALRQYALYQGDEKHLTLEGVTAWDPAEKIFRSMGVFTTGGLIHSGSYAKEALGANPRILEFSFASAASYETSKWRSVETHVDEDTEIEEGQMWSEGQWKTMSRLTYRRYASYEAWRATRQLNEGASSAGA